MTVSVDIWQGSRCPPSKTSFRSPVTLYAILPNWSKGRFVLRVPLGKPVHSVTLLGSNAALRFRSTSTSVTLDLPDLPEKLRTQPA